MSAPGSGLASLGFLQKLLQVGPTSPGQDPTAPASPQPDDGSLSAALAPPAMPIQPQQSAPQQQGGTQPPRDPNADLQEFQQQGQTKGHKLLQILQAGLVGGLSGMSANAQTYAQTGRNAGFGGGVGAGYTQSLPFMQKLQGQELRKGDLGNQILSTQAQYGPWQQFLEMLKSGAVISKDQAQTGLASAEAGKAKFVTPRGGGVYDVTTGKFAPGTEPQDKSQTVDNLIAAAASRAQAAGRDPSQDPEVKQLSDIKTSLQRESQPKTQNDFDQFYGKFLRDNKLPDTAANMQRAHQQFEVKPVQPGAGDARLDRSYQFNSTQLEKLGKPIDDAVTRMGRLQDTLSQNSPQADALVAPELLTVMAGGQGSGLRMNEAEISRIVGGRSNWQSLQAAANKWSLDPKTANSITPAQRQQIRALVQTVQQKLTAKQSALDEASQAMINANDPTEHRRIVAGARSKLTAVDQGQQGGGASQGTQGLTNFHVNPQTGERIGWDGKQWVRAQ